MPNKVKKNQKEDLKNVQGRDLFQTPNYAIDILIPFLVELEPIWEHSANLKIWECAKGEGKIVKRLQTNNYFDVFGTDLQDKKPFNFLTDIQNENFDVIVTNPPFSIK